MLFVILVTSLFYQCFILLFQFLVAEHGSVQKEKVTEDYNDAYPLKILSFL